MKLFKKLFLLLCLFSGLLLRADELLDISRELDFFENAFVTAAGEPVTSENHRQVEKRLRDFHSRLVQFQRKLQKQRVPRIPNFVTYSMELKRVFGNFGILNKKKGKLPYLKQTGMKDYTRVFLRTVRQQAREKGQPRPRTATLKNVNVQAYCAWLDDVAQANIALISKKKFIKAATRNALESYILNIVGLRKCVVVLAQNKFYKP